MPDHKTLNAEEAQILRASSVFARAMYLIAMRPYANSAGLFHASEEVIHARMSRVCRDSEIDMDLFASELDKLVKRKRISTAYRDTALSLMSELH